MQLVAYLSGDRTEYKNDKPSLPAWGRILITENMPTPTNQQHGSVELFNATTKILLLQGVFFGDRNHDTAFDRIGCVFLVKSSHYPLVAASKNPRGAGGPVRD